MVRVHARFLILAVLMGVVSPSLAHQAARTATYTDKPLRIKVRQGDALHLSFPSAIRKFKVPVGAGQIEFISPTSTYPNDLNLKVNDPPKSLTFSVPTATGRLYTVELIAVQTNPDTHVTIVDGKEEAEREAQSQSVIDAPVQESFSRLVETSPLKEPMMALLYSQLGGHPTRAFPGVKMTAVKTLVWDDEVERREHIWDYQGRGGLGGFTYVITNKSKAVQGISLPKLGSEYANALYLTFQNLGPKLDGDRFKLAPGASGLLHVITHSNR